MTIDLDEITPAPWRAEEDPVGHWRILHPHSVRSSVARGAKFFAQADAEIVVLLRNALDVQLRRGWTTTPSRSRALQLQWSVQTELGDGMPMKFLWLPHAGRFPLPAEALVEADRWFKENMEAQSG